MKYIEANVSTKKLEKLPFPPLREIFASKAYWALQITHIGGTWGTFTLMTAVPTYMNNIQHVTLIEVSVSMLSDVHILHLNTSGTTTEFLSRYTQCKSNNQP